MTNVDVINKLDNTLRISKGVEEILFVLAYSVDLDPVNGDTFPNVLLQPQSHRPERQNRKKLIIKIS